MKRYCRYINHPPKSVEATKEVMTDGGVIGICDDCARKFFTDDIKRILLTEDEKR